MPKQEQSDSESEETRENSSSEKLEESDNGSKSSHHEEEAKVSEYEKQRLRRMRENKARMEAMGLRNMASKLVGSVPKQGKKSKGKGTEKVVEEDEEYIPGDGDEEWTSESEEDVVVVDDDDDEEFVASKGSASRSRKVLSPLSRM